MEELGWGERGVGGVVANGVRGLIIRELGLEL